MRHHVPFVGERKVVRADDEPSRAKRASGRVIDDVVGEGVGASSWEDVVPEGWVDPSAPKSLKAKKESAPARPSASVPLPKVPFRPASKSASSGTKSAASSSAAKKTTRPSSAITFSDSAGLDWTPINNGRGLRVNIHGAIDNDLRKEWARLLDGTAQANVEEYEFNLSETPALSLTGLGMLLLFKERKGFGREAITLCNCNKEVAELLQWTGMDKYFLIKTIQIIGAS